MTNDVLIRNGLIVDGGGAAPFVGDVAIAAGQIVEVGPHLAATAKESIDASGLVVAPGFIDVHTHYDAQMFWDPLLGSSVQYGITTVVTGNCGFGVAPVRPGEEDYLIQLLARVEGMSATALEIAVPWSWTSFNEYLDRLERPLGPNIIPLLGHSALRYAVMGIESTERTASATEISQMQQLLDGALRGGAWGFSSSATPTHNDLAGRPAPSRAADLREFEALADVLARYPFGVIGMAPATKLRGFSSEDRSLLGTLSLRGKASVNWNPLKYVPSIPDLWKTNLSASLEAQSKGAMVLGVFNPATGGDTRVDFRTCFRFDVLPRWKLIAAQPLADKIAAFSDPEVRRALADDLEHDTANGMLTAHLRKIVPALRITQVFSDVNGPYVGRIVCEIASESNRSALDVIFDVAIADELRTVFIYDDPREEDPAASDAWKALVDSPYVMFGGTDAGAHIDMLANESLPVMTLEWRVREQGTLPLEKAISGFTADIADRIGLADRGRLVPGMAADVAIIDLEQVGAGDPTLVTDLPGGGERLVTKALGVEYTIVNGKVTYRSGEPTGSLTGSVLRASAHASSPAPLP